VTSGIMSPLWHDAGIEISGAFLVVTHCPFRWMIFGESVRSEDRPGTGTGVADQGVLAVVSSSAARARGTIGCAVAFLGKRLYTVPPVHYRDETDICGLVARGGLVTTDNPTRFGPASSRRYRPRAGDPLHGVRLPFPCAPRRDRQVTR
jgi:hypothetical protein